MTAPADAETVGLKINEKNLGPFSSLLPWIGEGVLFRFGIPSHGGASYGMWRRERCGGVPVGLLDFLKKTKPSVSKEQVCYDLAYLVLPHFVHRDFREFAAFVRKGPEAAANFLCLLASKIRDTEPDQQVAKSLKWHFGKPGESARITIEYPTPRKVDISEEPSKNAAPGVLPFVLAPYFSCVVPMSDRAARYFVLGQSLDESCTTLREVTPDGVNANLGVSAEPRLEAFHEAIKSYIFAR